MLILGPVPTAAKDDVFHNSGNGKQTFVIKAEKVPNAAGIRRVIGLLGGPSATWEDVLAKTPEIANLKGGWIVGGYLSNWVPLESPELFRKGFRVVQDILPSSLSASADIVHCPPRRGRKNPARYGRIIRASSALRRRSRPPEGVRREESDVYYTLLGRSRLVPR